MPSTTYLNTLLALRLLPASPPVAHCKTIDILGPPFPDAPAHVEATRHVLGAQTLSEAPGPSNIQDLTFGGSRRTYYSGTHYRVAYRHDADPGTVEGILCGRDWHRRLEVIRRAFVGCFGEKWWTQGRGIISGSTYTISSKDGRCTITASHPTNPGVSIHLWWQWRLRRVSIDDLVWADRITPQVGKVYLNYGIYVCKMYPLYLTPDVDQLKEIRIAARLRDSPYIMKIHALVVRGQRCVGFLMPYATMGSLLEARRARLYGWMERREYAHDIVRGVRALHAINEYHGDLNPRNIVLQWVPELEDRPMAVVIDLEANGGRTFPFSDRRLGREHLPSAGQDIYSIGQLMRWLAYDKVIDEGEWGVHELPEELPEYVNPWYRDAIAGCVCGPDTRCTLDELAEIFDRNMYLPSCVQVRRP